MEQEKKDNLVEALLYVVQTEMFFDYALKLSSSIPEVQQFNSSLDRNQLNSLKNRIQKELDICEA